MVGSDRRERNWRDMVPSWAKALARHIRDGLLTAPDGRISFAQEGEDLLLDRLLEGRQNGFYVDVGAHHPTRFSNTYRLYRRGWRGINIDAAPGSMKAFNRRRPRDINLEIAVGEPGERMLYLFDDPALNSMDQELSEERDEKTQYRLVGTKEVAVRPLREILAEHVPADVDSVDLMSVDVEGLDLEVLQSNDWSRFRPSLLLMEILNSGLEDLAAQPEIEYLESQGYVPKSKLFNSVLLIDGRQPE